MSDRHILTIGYVPVSCTAETILCGDPETSGTQEVNIIIDGDMVSCAECQFSYDGSHAKWFTPTDKLWTAIVNKCVKPVMREKPLTPGALVACWSVFLGHSTAKRGIRTVAEEDDCGSFPTST